MVKVTFKTVQGGNFQLDLDASTKVLNFCQKALATTLLD